MKEKIQAKLDQYKRDEAALQAAITQAQNSLIATQGAIQAFETVLKEDEQAIAEHE